MAKITRLLSALHGGVWCKYFKLRDIGSRDVKLRGNNSKVTIQQVTNGSLWRNIKSHQIYSRKSRVRL
jgi:hypothetical protein